MKLVMLMYLEEDDDCVAGLLEKVEVAAYSRLPIEGRGPGTAGWYGDVAPYHSRMVMVVASDETAAALLDAVEECRDVEDPRHPIRAVQVDVERVASCLCEPTGEETPTSTEE